MEKPFALTKVVIAYKDKFSLNSENIKAPKPEDKDHTSTQGDYADVMLPLPFLDLELSKL